MASNVENQWSLYWTLETIRLHPSYILCWLACFFLTYAIPLRFKSFAFLNVFFLQAHPSWRPLSILVKHTALIRYDVPLFLKQAFPEFVFRKNLECETTLGVFRLDHRNVHCIYNFVLEKLYKHMLYDNLMIWWLPHVCTQSSHWLFHFLPLYTTLKQHNQTRFFALDHAKRTKKIHNKSIL